MICQNAHIVILNIFSSQTQGCYFYQSCNGIVNKNEFLVTVQWTEYSYKCFDWYAIIDIVINIKCTVSTCTNVPTWENTTSLTFPTQTTLSFKSKVGFTLGQVISFEVIFFNLTVLVWFQNSTPQTPFCSVNL